LRTNQDYAVKVSQDSSWVPKGREQDFHLQAFSGSQTDHESHKGHVQLNDIKDNTDMILLQAGGDNASFAAVAYACIFAPEGQEWGPAYPDPKGRCYREIEKSQQYIFGKGENQLFQDTRALINTIFGHEKVQSNPDFRLSSLATLSSSTPRKMRSVTGATVLALHFARMMVQSSVSPFVRRSTNWYEASMMLSKRQLLVVFIQIARSSSTSTRRSKAIAFANQVTQS
jgi:hypothetical protein